MAEDGKPLSRAFYDDSMSGQSNARIVPQLLPDWPYKQQEVREHWGGTLCSRLELTSKLVMCLAEAMGKEGGDL